MKIGITDPMGADERYQNYARWINLYAPDAEIVRLSYRLGNAPAADGCSGIILTGGGDVDPSLYGGPVRHPALSGVDPERDRFERQVLDGVLARPRPFLGICRGMQFTNVILGGTLMVDIEESGYPSHRSPADAPAFHPVVIAGTGPLSQAAGVSPRAGVNTHHHQAVEKIAPGLRVAAAAADGIVEALEMGAAEHFFLLVQWHPERMADQSSPCAGNIAKLFLEELSNYLKQYPTLP